MRMSAEDPSNPEQVQGSGLSAEIGFGNTRKEVMNGGQKLGSETTKTDGGNAQARWAAWCVGRSPQPTTQ
jgi:hypothetical protein